MARPLNELGALGAKVAAAFDDDADKRRFAIKQAERLFLAKAIGTTTHPPRLGRGWLISMAAGLSLAVLTAFVLLRTPRRLEFTVDGNAGQAQTWLASPAARPVVVKFSDGTLVKVDPLSRARVVDTDNNGASLALESGSLSADVVHTSHSAWRVIAGPFAVRVTGTRFDLRWDTASQQFSISVREGSVSVAGSIVGAERPVRAGETLIASVAERRFDLIGSEVHAALSLSPSAEAPAVPVTDGPAFGDPGVPASSAASVAPEPAIEPVAPEAPGKDAAGGWRELAKKGDLRQAFASADARGFQSVCDGATAAELLVLGDAARVSGRADRATEALFTLRRRYPRDPRRAAAAFALGKVAFDQRHAYAQAAEWFSTCMREQPSGPLVREAWGRRVEALRNAGDSVGAQRVAREYLARYPDGPHADIARSVLK